MSNDPLLNQLRHFAKHLAAKKIRLIIGGGYGVLLKATYIQRIGARTRVEQLPTVRSTADIDVFLPGEVIVDGNSMAAIRQTLDELGYSVVPNAEYYHFFREVTVEGIRRNLKFDFLDAPVLGEESRKVKIDDRRIRPRKALGAHMHAHTTREAFSVEEHLLKLDIGDPDAPIDIYLPHPFSYVVLKLFALRDQVDNAVKGFGRHHAFDIYATWAMMMDGEFEEAEQLRIKYSDFEVMSEAINIAQSLFADTDASGMIRLKEHARTADVQLIDSTEFLKDIGGLFSKRSGA